MKSVKETKKENIRQKQRKLNYLLSEKPTTTHLISKEVLELSQELDKLIVKYYNKKS